MPPPRPPLALPENVVLLTVSVPVLLIAPPWLVGALLEMTEFVTVSVPATLLMAPPVPVTAPYCMVKLSSVRLPVLFT